MIDFLKRHPLSIKRVLPALLVSAVSGFGVITFNYETYWKVTIHRTQTVDFNILANVLPYKVSTHLLNNDIEGLQEALDTNYGLFGILITDCKTAEINCPNQKILYGSKSKVESTDTGKQRLVPVETKYAKGWIEKLNQSNSLNNEVYVLLRDPPSTKPDWSFESPRENKQIFVSGQQSQSSIIGRVYGCV